MYLKAFIVCATSNSSKFERSINGMEAKDELYELISSVFPGTTTLAECDKDTEIKNPKELYLLLKHINHSLCSDSLIDALIQLTSQSELNRYYCFKCGILNLLLKRIEKTDSQKCYDLFSTIGSSFFSRTDLFCAISLIQSNPQRFALPIFKALAFCISSHHIYMPSSFFHINKEDSFIRLRPQQLLSSFTFFTFRRKNAS